MAFKRLEDQRVGKARRGCVGSFSDILATFKEIPPGASDPGAEEGEGATDTALLPRIIVASLAYASIL